MQDRILNNKEIEETRQFINECIVKYIDKEEEEKLHPSWKKIRPSKDAFSYRLPGSINK